MYGHHVIIYIHLDIHMREMFSLTPINLGKMASSRGRAVNRGNLDFTTNGRNVCWHSDLVFKASITSASFEPLLGVPMQQCRVTTNRLQWTLCVVGTLCLKCIKRITVREKPVGARGLAMQPPHGAIAVLFNPCCCFHAYVTNCCW